MTKIFLIILFLIAFSVADPFYIWGDDGAGNPTDTLDLDPETGIRYQRQGKILFSVDTSGSGQMFSGFNALQTHLGAWQSVAVFTIDDAHDDDYLVWYPLFQAEGVPFTSFITTGEIGGGGYLTWAQCSIMQANGIEMGCHTDTHPHLPQLDSAEIEAELLRSIARADSHNITFKSLGYPFSESNSLIRRISSKYFKQCRGGGSKINPHVLETYDIRSLGCDDPGDSLTYFAHVDSCDTDNKLIVFIFHGSVADTYVVRCIIDSLQARNVPIVTFDSALTLVGNKLTLSDGCEVGIDGHSRIGPITIHKDTTDRSPDATIVSAITATGNAFNHNSDKWLDWNQSNYWNCYGEISAYLLLPRNFLFHFNEDVDLQCPYNNQKIIINWTSPKTGKVAVADSADTSYIEPSQIKTERLVTDCAQLTPKKEQALISFIFDDINDTDSSFMYYVFNGRGEVANCAVWGSKIGDVDRLTWSEISFLQDEGWEMLNHTWDHPHLPTISLDSIRDEFRVMQDSATVYNITMRNLVYPYNEHVDSVRQVAREFFRCALEEKAIRNTSPLLTYELARKCIDDDSDSLTYKAIVDSCETEKSWLVFYAHQTDANDSAHIGRLIDYIGGKGISIVTVNQALNLISNPLEYHDNFAMDIWGKFRGGLSKGDTFKYYDKTLEDTAYVTMTTSNLHFVSETPFWWSTGGSGLLFSGGTLYGEEDTIVSIGSDAYRFKEFWGLRGTISEVETKILQSDTTMLKIMDTGKDGPPGYATMFVDTVGPDSIIVMIGSTRRGIAIE